LPTYVTLFDVWFSQEPHFLQAWLLNLDNKPCDVDGNELIFLDSVDASASNSGYPELDADIESPTNEHNGPKLKKWILTTIKE
jgi:hypothetical protein